MNLFLDSLSRMEEGSNSVFNLTNLEHWLMKYTFINNAPFSFKDREFQLDILRDPKKEQIVVKCAQVGLSEILYRWAVASCCIMRNFNVIYTFPTATDAEDNNRTRIDPMIKGSKEMSRLVNPELNNSKIKQFGENSFLFFKGTMSDTAALSTPADAVINDEYDKSDMDVATTYTSRLQDRPTKIHKRFSTPTVAGYGVHKEAQTANRLFHFVRCNCCNHTFLPDYYKHIVIPGYDKSLEEITKETLAHIRWEEAHMVCPKCGRDPQMHYTRMPWVCENPDLNYPGNAWHVSPFSAHKRILIPNIIKDSTKYKKVSEFKNQVLGIVAEEASSSITEDDMNKSQAYSVSAGDHVHQMGVDLGISCRIVIGRIADSGEMIIVHKERCHYSRLEDRIAELRGTYRVTMQVLDSYPYSDIVNRVCGNPMAWGAQYVNSKSLQLYSLKAEEAELEEGKLGFRQVYINRNVAFDELLALVKSGKLIVNKDDEANLFSAEFRSMKQITALDKVSGGIKHVWVKTDGEDHYHNATLYLYIAIQMRQMAGSPGLAALGVRPVRAVLIGPRHRAPDGRRIEKVTAGIDWR